MGFNNAIFTDESSTHPRCECHACTQARIPISPLLSYDPATTNVSLVIEPVIAAERARCAKIAESQLCPLTLSVDYATGFWAAEKLIADKIRSGE